MVPSHVRYQLVLDGFVFQKLTESALYLYVKMISRAVECYVICVTSDLAIVMHSGRRVLSKNNCGHAFPSNFCLVVLFIF